jgi:prophage tail gpP-like protein
MNDAVRIEVEHLTDPTEEILVIDSWESYDIDSDMMTDADAFTWRVQPRRDYIDFFKIPGHVARLYVADSLQMTGFIEATPDKADTGGAEIQLTGRDFAGVLVDSAAPLLDLTDMTLLAIVEKMIEPWAGIIPGVITDYGDYRFITQAHRSWNGYTSAQRASRAAKKATQPADRKKATAAAKRLRQKKYTRSPWGALNSEKIFKEPTQIGGSRWKLIRSLAGFLGVHAWMAPDGYVVLARPEYQQNPVGQLYVHIDDDGNITGSNCTASRQPDIGDRYCDYSLVGQGYSSKAQKGVDLNSYAVARDPSKSFWYDMETRRLPKTYIEAVPRVQDKKMLVRKARTMAEENIIRSYNFQVNVEGHRTTDVMPSTDVNDIGPLWAVDTIADVDYQPKAMTGPHYIRRRQFTGDKDEGQQTNLTPIPSDIWLASDHDKVSDSVWANKLRNTMEHYAL